MIRAILSLLLFVFVLNFSHSQTLEEKINHTINRLEYNLTFDKAPYLLEGEKYNLINYYNSIDESKPGMPALPSRTIFIAIPPHSKVRLNFLNEKFNILNNVFVKVNPELQLNYDTTLTYRDSKINPTVFRYEIYPNEKYFIEGYTWIRDYYCAVVRINTHQYNTVKRQVRELLSAKIKIDIYDEKPFTINTSPISEFDKVLNKIILNYSEAKKNFRAIQPTLVPDDSSGNWIDYSKEYVNLQIPNDGIYRIDYNDVLNYGVPQSVNPKSFKLFSKGKEIPLYVFGEGDLSFDPGDYIEFWSRKNYGYSNYRNHVGQGEDYLTFLDIYSDTSIVWLTWDGNDGNRVADDNIIVPGLTDSITSHLAKIHLERDLLFWYYGFEYPRIQLPFWHESKTWIWKQVSSGSTNSTTFSANSIVPNTSVYTVSRLNSWYSDGIIQNAHKYGARLNSTGIQDSVIFDYETTANLVAVFNSNDLISGTNNYRIVGMANDSGRTHKAVLDWIDIDYYQYTSAVNDSILIHIPDSVTSQLRVVKISNYTSDSSSTIIYKINPVRKRISSFLINGNILTFTDTVKGSNQYFIINENYLKQPLLVKKKQFVNLRNTNKQADYILITNKLLQTSSIDYSEFIESNYNINVETIFVEDIYDEFGYGYLKPEPIKDFLEYAYFNWQTPKPTYLTLLGDCTYDYKNLFTIAPGQLKKILVPSYGDPVSDSWYTMWDTTNINIQQMFVGRIPANNNEEVYRYLEKHQLYLQRGFDEWNKNFLLFSGGYPEFPIEMQQIKAANDVVLNNIIHPSPVGGEAVHFYKTISPPTNLGPYTAEEIRTALNRGGLFISYVGHSGTRTWDNGITEPSDIMNSFNDRLPVISDNGCSTGKYAEPDIDAFGELFLTQDQQGQAIAYLGNSSLGYTSTSYRMGELFYKRLIVDTSNTIGEAHFLSKLDNFNGYGYGDVNRLFNYCNILLGDPIIKLAYPDKSNFYVDQNSIKLPDEFITDTQDSIKLKIIIENLGRVCNDSLEVDITGRYADTLIYANHFVLQSPYYKDTLNITVSIYGLAGEHKIQIELDKDNLINEVNELDNSFESTFIVYSTKIRPLESEYYYNSTQYLADVLNPTIFQNIGLNNIEFALSTNSNFNNQTLFEQLVDSVHTQLIFSNLIPDTRYYWRARLKDSGLEWGQTISFFNNHNYSWMINHSFNQDDVIENQIEFDSITQGWAIREGVNQLKLASAGFIDGKYASIQYDYLEYVPNIFFRGFATAIIDTFDLHPEDIKSFKYPVSPTRDSLINYLNSLGGGSLLAVVATDEVSEFFNGSLGDSLKQIFREFGSIYVDSIGWRDSWAMIGIKGATQGAVPEAFSKSSQGAAVIDTSKYVRYSSGTLQFPVIENSVKWVNAVKKDSIPLGASINYYPIGYKENGDIDTLNLLQFVSDQASLDFIDNNIYRKISVNAEMSANSQSESPMIKEFAVNFISPPELATNYQVVSASADTVTVGENIDLNFSVYNVGESKADSFLVTVDVVNDDNSRQNIFSQNLDSLTAGGKSYFHLSFNTSAAGGSKSFLITIDKENNVRELFEDNNFFTIPFYIKPDTTTPTLTLTIDGNDIVDGEYISSTPVMHIELDDFSLLAINDRNSVMIFLNNVEIPNDTSIINYEFSTNNPKVKVDFTPELADGEYSLKVLWRDSNGNIVDSSGVQKFFLVSSEAKILDVYNYPNPFTNETYFTFKLTQIPDEIKIKIFTIAGRLIRELEFSSSDLRYDFNKIPWDGTDQDGDKVANGVYLYKVIMKAGEKSESVTQKLAVVR